MQTVNHLPCPNRTKSQSNLTATRNSDNKLHIKGRNQVLSNLKTENKNLRFFHSRNHFNIFIINWLLLANDLSPNLVNPMYKVWKTFAFKTSSSFSFFLFKKDCYILVLLLEKRLRWWDDIPDVEKTRKVYSWLNSKLLFRTLSKEEKAFIVEVAQAPMIISDSRRLTS